MNKKTINIGGIELPIIMAASGAVGNFGEAYWYSRFEEKYGILNKDGLGFVSKTATCKLNLGNTPFVYDGKNYPPAEIKPKSIKINIATATILNAVGLSNPGLQAFLDTNNWQKRESPFIISIMCTGKTKENRLIEMKEMISMLKKAMPDFNSTFVLQINLSCPNTGHDNCELSLEANELINIAAELKVPIMAKFSIASSSIESLITLEANQNLAAICLSNTIPYNWFPDKEFYGENLCNIWKKPFGNESPLSSMGNGGISGRLIKPFVLEFITKLREAGFKKHINGGGGIMHPSDIDLYKKAGADSFFIGSVMMVRPWSVKSIIKRANEIF